MCVVLVCPRNINIYSFSSQSLVCNIILTKPAKSTEIWRMPHWNWHIWYPITNLLFCVLFNNIDPTYCAEFVVTKNLMKQWCDLIYGLWNWCLVYQFVLWCRCIIILTVHLCYINFFNKTKDLFWVVLLVWHSSTCYRECPKMNVVLLYRITKKSLSLYLCIFHYMYWC